MKERLHAIFQLAPNLHLNQRIATSCEFHLLFITIRNFIEILGS